MRTKGTALNDRGAGAPGRFASRRLWHAQSTRPRANTNAGTTSDCCRSRTKVRGNPPRERAAEFAITRERKQAGVCRLRPRRSIEYAGTLDGPAASTNRVKRPEQLHDQWPYPL